MKRNKVSGLLIVILLAGLALFPLHASAQEDAPQAVVDSRNGVFRIITEYEDGTGLGSGFAVGTEDDPYIVTNNHVVADDPSEVYILYDTGRYVEAEIVTASALRDIAILKPLGKIPDLQVLPLETQTFDSGMSVYALGYPYAADLLAAGIVEYEGTEDILDNIAADNQSQTVTNGIVSAIIDSVLVSADDYEDLARLEGHTTRLIQTNTALNSGNSGGPLLNLEGHVVGVNTLGLGADFEAMNGSVHVDELIRELRNANIEFAVPYGDVTQNTAQAGGADLLSYIGWVVGAVVLLLALGIGLGLNRRKNTKKISKNGVTLAGFERQGRGLDPATVAQWSIDFIKELQEAAGSGDPNNLLNPENIEINQKITLLDGRDKNASASSIQLFPGYSAPENYRNRTSKSAAVYFVGAMMSTLLTGRRPEDALTREEKKQPLFTNPGTLGGIVNAATQPDESKRLPDLGALLNELEYKSQAIQYESAYRAQPSPGGYRLNQ